MTALSLFELIYIPELVTEEVSSKKMKAVNPLLNS